MLSSEELEVLATSFWVVANAVFWSLPFAIAAAFTLSRPRFPGKLLLDAIAHLPIILPPVLVGFVLLMLPGRRGAARGTMGSFLLGRSAAGGARHSCGHGDGFCHGAGRVRRRCHFCG
jgi:molybdate transport system permease protein